MPWVYDIPDALAVSKEYEAVENKLRTYETDIKNSINFNLNASDYKNPADLKGDYYNAYEDKVDIDANAWIEEANKLKDEFNNVFLPALASRIKEAETEKNNALKQHWEPDSPTP